MDLLEYARGLATSGNNQQQQNAQFLQTFIHQGSSTKAPEKQPDNRNNNLLLIGGLVIFGIVALLDIGGNLITNLDLSNNPKLKHISVSGLKIKQDLNTFSHLKELEHLCLDSCDFYGSLRPLAETNHDFLISRISKLEQQLIEQEKITNKVLKENEQSEKQLANEKQTFLTTAEKLNNYISQLEGSETQPTGILTEKEKIEIQSKFALV
ncbi:12628_t:CDS:2 [Ambispora gerdemannii]|uniref:12628_t:CDS:1 n=1 Tax=Ambispora gerdemannii TaxID=144530 RepID=A0A9N9AZ57_9GLOM|nr:12628_t:CDS:2 [Ambispora gerdemannii]